MRCINLTLFILVLVGVKEIRAAIKGNSSAPAQDAVDSDENSGESSESEESSGADFEAPSLDAVSFQADAPFEGEAVSTPGKSYNRNSTQK